jgi:hypothetical protein
MTDREALIERVKILHDAILERAQAEELGEPVEFFAAIICNNCGHKLVAPDSLQLAVGAVKEGWVVGMMIGDADLCQTCAS